MTEDKFDFKGALSFARWVDSQKDLTIINNKNGKKEKLYKVADERYRFEVGLQQLIERSDLAKFASNPCLILPQQVDTAKTDLFKAIMSLLKLCGE